MKRIEARLATLGAAVPTLLFPAENVDLTRFSVVACDQYSAEPAYWEDIVHIVGDAPSSLSMIMPEAWLRTNPAHEAAIPAAMERFLSDGTLRSLGKGMVFLHRQTTTGIRRGLVLALDLEQYDFTPGSRSLIRATEQTVAERLPARIAIRKKAALELPHIMVLLDDRENRLMGAMDRLIAGRAPLYDFSLMKQSGTLTGWLLNDEADLAPVADALEYLHAQAADGMLYAMGDGNHSFAAAKKHWDALKPTLTPEEAAVHPARYGLVELVNLYDPALSFEPIHRLLMHVDPDAIQKELAFDAENPPSLQELQPVLDEWLSRHPEAELEYIHGAENCRRLGKEPNCLAIVWKDFDKGALFADVAKHGVLCRKSFSMGAAADKRFYLECRKIR